MRRSTSALRRNGCLSLKLRRMCNQSHLSSLGTAYSICDLDLSNPRVHNEWVGLHLQWLYAHTLWEEADQVTLDDPVGNITARGGRVLGLYETNKTRKVGALAASVALRPVQSVTGVKEDLRWEIIKMAVSPNHQGRGLGNLILKTAISNCREELQMTANSLGLQRAKGIIQLDTSQKLKAALHLYQQHGFKVMPLEVQRYETADVYLELSLELSSEIVKCDG